MSAAIRPGDLVMVVRPNVCCGAAGSIGMVGAVMPNPAWATYAQCDFCGAINLDANSFRTIEGSGYHVDTLQKIDPLTEDDSAPMRHEIEVPA